MSKLDSHLRQLQLQLDRAREASIGEWEEQTAANHRRPPSVESRPPDLSRHVGRAKIVATYVTLVGGAIVAVALAYMSQRDAALRDGVGVKPAPVPDVVLGTPVVNPESQLSVPSSSSIPQPLATQRGQVPGRGLGSL
jgi:hypothetical protein